MSNSDLKTFPQNKYEAITMLYLEQQNLQGKTPEEVVAIYQETLTKVKSSFRANR